MVKDLVSIVMPTYNDEKYLKKAINDILNQTYKQFEFIIVNDGSTDNTEKILKDFLEIDDRIKVLNKKNGGTGSALNMGFAIAQGEFGTWVSSDDEKEPNFIEELVKCLKNNRDVEFACSAFFSKYLNKVFKPYHYVNDSFVFCGGLSHDSTTTGKYVVVEDWAKINSRACFQGVCFLFTMRLKNKCGPYIQIPGEDYHMTMMMGLNSKVIYLDKVLGQHNNPEDSLSMQNRNCVHEANVLTRKLYSSSSKWNLEKIPKIANFYWGAPKMSFLRYMTIYSFKKFNPDWSVHLYVPKNVSLNLDWRSDGNDNHHSSDTINYSDKDYYNKLLEDVAVKVIKVDFSNTFIGKDAPEAHKSDLLTWKILSTNGGIWCDMDIIFVNSLNLSDINNYNKVDTILCFDQSKERALNCVPIGFLGASNKNIFFKKILVESMSIYNKNSYQSIGTEAIYRVSKTFSEAKNKFNMLNMLDLNAEDVYYLHFKKIDQIFEKKVALPANVFGIHWYGGHPLSQKFNNLITDENYKDYDSTICSLICEILK